MSAPKHRRKYRFAAVGIINTLIDFTLLFILRSLGLPTIGANILSTSTAFVFSFFANRSYTFKAKNPNSLRTQLWRFTAVTLFSLWILQSAVIAISEPVFAQFVTAGLDAFFAKVLATAASLIFNYYLYALFVFRDNTDT